MSETAIQQALQKQQRKEAKKGKKKTRLLALLILLVSVFLIIIVLHQLGYLRFPWETDSVVAGNLFPGEGEAEEGYLSNMTEDEIREQMQKAADAAYFSFKINARPVFADGQSAGNLEIENPSYNVYPMVVEIYLDETGEKIYDSGGILPDRHIDNAKLTKVLKAGSHEATAHMLAYDPETEEFLGKQQAALVITVEQ